MIRVMVDPLMRLALIAAGLSSISFGIIGTYVVARRITYIAGAIWSIGMAIGLIFIAKTPGYLDPMSYLFGNILMITTTDLWLMLFVDFIVITVAVVLYHKYQALFFDEEFASIRGINTKLHYIALLCLIATAIVTLVTTVGIVLVIALLTLPAAISGSFSRKIWQMMMGAIIITFFSSFTGLWYAYEQDLPTSPVIIIVTAIFYTLSVIGHRFRLKRRRQGNRVPCAK